jgi:hypothetical protein
VETLRGLYHAGIDDCGLGQDAGDVAPTKLALDRDPLPLVREHLGPAVRRPIRAELKHRPARVLADSLLTIDPLLVGEQRL